jgi:hypothetical protein
MSVFNNERGILKKKLQEIPGGISLTTDIWTTSTYEKSFMAITIHYLDSSWQMKHLLLDFIHMDGPHSGIEISNALEECLHSMGLISKLVSITHDNAAANIKFLNEFSKSVAQNGVQFDCTQQSIRCFGHVLNLAMQNLLMYVGSEVEKLRTLIKSIRGSRPLRKKFKMICEMNNMEVLKPILDVTTRWNSSCEMIERALKVQNVLDAVARTEGELNNNVLTKVEWNRLKQLVEILQPFKEATVIMSSSSYPTLSMVVPFYHELLKTLEDSMNNNEIPEWLSQGCDAAKKKLLNYCEKTNILHFTAIVLDPRLKFQYFEELGWSSHLITQIKNM